MIVDSLVQVVLKAFKSLYTDGTDFGAAIEHGATTTSILVQTLAYGKAARERLGSARLGAESRADIRQDCFKFQLSSSLRSIILQ